MKKLIYAIIVALALSVPIQSLALDLSSLDLFSAMSVYDLIRARNIISEELMMRGYSEYTLIKGKYTVGETIPPGVYMLSTPELSHSVLFFVYSEDGERIAYRSVGYDWLHNEYTERNGRYQIELEEGHVLDLWGPITFYKY